MARGRKPSHVESSIVDTQLGVDRNEVSKLTRLAKSWEYTCSFCFKKFPSAQAIGGHQNAHRNERLEERRLFIKDPIGYRKRAFLRAMKDMEHVPSSGPTPGLNLTSATRMMKNELANVSQVNSLPILYSKPALLGDFGESSSRVSTIAAKSPAEYNAAHENYVCQPYDPKFNGKNLETSPVALCLFPPKELNLAEKLGVHAEDTKAKAPNESALGSGIKFEELDLKLKL